MDVREKGTMSLYSDVDLPSTFELGDESFVFAFSDHSERGQGEFSFGGLDKEFGESRELRSGFKRAAWVVGDRVVFRSV